jgi:hypothetical protein
MEIFAGKATQGALLCASGEVLLCDVREEEYGLMGAGAGSWKKEVALSKP